MNDCPNGYHLANASDFENENTLNLSGNCQEYVLSFNLFKLKVKH
jgi:hypothetical protein